MKIMIAFALVVGVFGSTNRAFALEYLTKAGCSDAAEIYNNNGYDCHQASIHHPWVWSCSGHGTSWTMVETSDGCIAY